MIAVTGGLGFIGFNLIKKLNQKNIKDIIIIDDLKTKKNNKKNLKELKYKEIIDFRNSIKKLKNSKKKIRCIFHNGANSDTSCWDAKDMFEKNYIYSKNLLDFALKNKTDFIYASSASVYGNNKNLNEDPLNLYAISKLIFDNYVRELFKKKKKLPIKLIGLRYFNVYGPFEYHKINMSSPILTFFKQAKKNSEIKIFDSIDNINFKKFTRDFVHVNDIVNINYEFYFLKKKVYGIFDLGSGSTVSFYKIALMLKKWFKDNMEANVKIKKIRFPQHLKNFYQFYTKSSNKKINQYFKNYKFIKINKGILDYSNFLKKYNND